MGHDGHGNLWAPGLHVETPAGNSRGAAWKCEAVDDSEPTFRVSLRLSDTAAPVAASGSDL